jgi:hypothetical protein
MKNTSLVILGLLFAVFGISLQNRTGRLWMSIRVVFLFWTACNYSHHASVCIF